MNLLNLTFKMSDEEIRHLQFPYKTIQEQIMEKFIEFRKSVFEEILKETNGDPKLITIIKNYEWTPDYSQILYDGVFQGHLYEDFVNCKFRFEPKN